MRYFEIRFFLVYQRKLFSACRRPTTLKLEHTSLLVCIIKMVGNGSTTLLYARCCFNCRVYLSDFSSLYSIIMLNFCYTVNDFSFLAKKITNQFYQPQISDSIFRHLHFMTVIWINQLQTNSVVSMCSYSNYNNMQRRYPFIYTMQKLYFCQLKCFHIIEIMTELH